MSEDDLLIAVMDAGAEDIQDTGEVFEVLISLESLPCGWVTLARTKPARSSPWTEP